MRQISLKYGGECARCGTELQKDQQAMYEKSMGIFCLECAPTEVEDIRKFRQLKADRKADRYEEWASKREQKAQAQFNSYSEIRHDWAFITQPGRIPLRERIIKADDRAIESLRKAEQMRDKAHRLRHVRVKGDAERKRQAIREARDEIIAKGSRVYDFCFGAGTVVGVYKKSYRIKFDNSGNTWSRDKSYVKLLTIQPKV